jgi:hypothetical protein
MCPARRLERPFPTLWSNSIDSTLSGWHCDVLKFDDVVSNNNCDTDETREKLQKQIINTLNLVDTWGWIDMLGTRYFPDDYYGERIAKSKKDPVEFGLKLFVRAAWTVKPKYAHLEEKKIRELTEDMVVLTFPDPINGAPFSKLRGQLLDDERTFRCQQLNQPVWGSTVPSFRIEDLKAAHRQISDDKARRLPGEIKILWDTAKTASKNSDYTVGAVFKIFQKDNRQVAAILLEVEFGKWTQSEIASHMIELDNRWKLWSTARIVHRVEDTGGLELLQMKVMTDSIARFGAAPQMFWIKPTNETDAKRNRIKGLEILLIDDRLFFVDGQWLHGEDGTFSQMVNYKGEKSSRTRKDDIPDAMSWITTFLPSSVELTEEEQGLLDIAIGEQRHQQFLKAQHEYYFGKSSPVVDPYNTPLDSGPQQPSSPYSDISKRLFGGNGMRA